MSGNEIKERRESDRSRMKLAQRIAKKMEKAVNETCLGCEGGFPCSLCVTRLGVMIYDILGREKNKSA